MNTLLSRPAEVKLLPDMAKRLSVVIACEDPLGVASAPQICSHMLEQLGENRAFTIRAWPFSRLANPAIALESASAAVAADFVVVAARHPTAELPMPVRAWLERWLAQKADRKMTLVAVFTQARGQPSHESAAVSCLKHIADEAGSAFFALHYEDEVPWHPESSEEIWLRAGVSPSLLQEILNRPIRPPRWGINE
ncbi:MAG: hypothetical protein L0Z50_43205 [Verrucomicrobiales bacterium]|nr:hypothetical protein [Verrucomicrobiales bacterium]